MSFIYHSVNWLRIGKDFVPVQYKKMRKLIHPNSKTHQSQQSRFSCNGSTLTHSRADPSNSSKMTLMSRIKNSPHVNSPSPPPAVLSDAESFKSVLKNCLEMCSAYIQALNTLCSTGTSLAESLGQVFGHNIKLTHVKCSPGSQSTQNSSKQVACDSSNGTSPSYADVLASNVDSQIYCDMAKQFFTVWHHLSNATAGASATIKTETLFALQDLINKIESASVVDSDASRHMFNVQRNTRLADQNDVSSTLNDSIESTKSCLLSYIELQTKFSYSSWKALNCLSKALKADSSMKDVVKRLNLEFDLKNQLSSKLQTASCEDRTDGLSSTLPFPMPAEARASKLANNSSLATSKRKKDRSHHVSTVPVDIDEILDLLSIRDARHVSHRSEKKVRSSVRKDRDDRKRRSTKLAAAPEAQSSPHKPLHPASSSHNQMINLKMKSCPPQNSRKHHSNRRANSPDGLEEYQKRIEAYSARQHRNETSRVTPRQESVHVNHLDPPMSNHQLENFASRLKVQSTSTWPGKGSINSSQATESPSSHVLPPFEPSDYLASHLDSWSPWSNNNSVGASSIDATRSVLEHIGCNVNSNSASSSSLAFDPFKTQCNPPSLKNGSRQLFKSSSEATARDSVLSGGSGGGGGSSSLNHVLNNNIAINDSSSAIGGNRFASLEDYVDSVSFPFSDRLGRFNVSNDSASPVGLTCDSPCIESVLTSELTAPVHHSPNTCMPSTPNLSIDPLRLAKTSTWPLKQSPINSTLANGSTALLHSDGLNDNGNPSVPGWLSLGQASTGHLLSFALSSPESQYIPGGASHNLWSIGPDCSSSDPFDRTKQDHNLVTNAQVSRNQQSLNRINNTSSNGATSQGNPVSRYSLFESNNNTCRSIDGAF